jgi:hypothetical protein
MGVMIRAWLQARASGPFSVSPPPRSAASVQAMSASGSAQEDQSRNRR